MALLLSAAKQEGVTTSSTRPRSVAPSTPVGRLEHGHPGVPAGSRPDRRTRRVVAVPRWAWTASDHRRRPLRSAPRSGTSARPRASGTGVYNRCAPDAGGQAPGSTKALRRHPHPHHGRRRSPAPTQLSLHGQRRHVLGVAVVGLAAAEHSGHGERHREADGRRSQHDDASIDDPKTLGLDGSMMAVVAAGKAFPPRDVHGHEDRGRQAQRRAALLRHRARGCQGADRLDERTRRDSSQTTVPGVPPLRSAAGHHVHAELLQQLRRRQRAATAASPTRRTFANPTAWRVGDPRRGTAHLAAARQPVHAHRRLTSASGRPGHDHPRQRRRERGDSAAVDRHQPVRRRYCHGERRTARLRQDRHPDDRRRRTADVYRRRPRRVRRLDVSIGNTADPNADLDLVVTGPSGQQQSADGDSEEAVSYP